MPIFEYQCVRCGHQFEFLIVPTSPKPACPNCRSRKLKQQLSLFAVSSETTRKLSLKAARRRDKKLGTEMAHAEHEDFHKHHD